MNTKKINHSIVGTMGFKRTNNEEWTGIVEEYKPSYDDSMLATKLQYRYKIDWKSNYGIIDTKFYTEQTLTEEWNNFKVPNLN